MNTVRDTYVYIVAPSMMICRVGQMKPQVYRLCQREFLKASYLQRWTKCTYAPITVPDSIRDQGYSILQNESFERNIDTHTRSKYQCWGRMEWTLNSDDIAGIADSQQHGCKASCDPATTLGSIGIRSEGWTVNGLICDTYPCHWNRMCLFLQTQMLCQVLTRRGNHGAERKYDDEFVAIPNHEQTVYLNIQIQYGHVCYQSVISRKLTKTQSANVA